MIYAQGQIGVGLRQGADISRIEELLKQHKHTKVFPDKTDDSDELSRMYVFSVPVGKEIETAQKVRELYKDIVKYAQIIPNRKLL